MLPDWAVAYGYDVVPDDDPNLNEAVEKLKDTFREGVLDHTRHLAAIEHVVAGAWKEF